MSPTLDQLRLAIVEALAKDGVPLPLLQQLARYIHQRHTDGLSFAAISRELGVSASSVFRWFRLLPAESSGEPLPSLVPVQLPPTPTPPQALPVLISPRGFRVEGLSLHQIQFLLSELR